MPVATVESVRARPAVPVRHVGEDVLDVRNLQTHFFTPDGVVKAVDGASFRVPKGKCVAVVGESGCGKSATAMSILRLVPFPPGLIVGGEVLFGGENLVTASEERMRQIRGNRIAMVFQEAGTALNPALSIGRQMSETMELHLKISAGEARRRSVELLQRVGISDPESRLDAYPHQFSGGMKQRIMIAMALSCRPEVIIADEPTTALDVTVQAQVLDLMDSLRVTHGTAILLITHNLGIVARYADRIIVMYAGNVVESGPAADIFGDLLHPYTLGLLNCVPRMDVVGKPLTGIGGSPPDMANLPPGCPFAPRCSFAMQRCLREKPELQEATQDHFRACFADPQLLRDSRRATPCTN